jgi:hypothetical protein
MITKSFHVLRPPYGRDYQTKEEVVEAFREGADFQGDVALGFKYCSKRDFKRGVEVELCYRQQSLSTMVKV